MQRPTIADIDSEGISMPTKGKSPQKPRGSAHRPRESQRAASDAAKDSTAQKPAQAPVTDDEKRRAKNECVKAWRAAHKEEYGRYMKEWREKKAKASGKTSTKKATPKREKKSPPADATQPTPAAAIGESAA